MTNITALRQSMIEAGVYSMEDINEICHLESEYAQECKKIEEECISEGYPGNGENYDLRCSNARRYYDDEIAYISSKYEDGEE